MAFTDINSEHRLVQATFAEKLRDKLGWEGVYAYNETFGPRGTLGRESAQDAVLVRELREALTRLVFPASNRSRSPRGDDIRKADQSLWDSLYRHCRMP